MDPVWEFLPPELAEKCVAHLGSQNIFRLVYGHTHIPSSVYKTIQDEKYLILSNKERHAMFCRDIIAVESLKLPDGLFNVYVTNFRVIRPLISDFFGRGDYIEAFNIFVLTMPMLMGEEKKEERQEFLEGLKKFLPAMRQHIMEKMNMTIFHPCNGGGRQVIFYSLHDLCQFILYFEIFQYFEKTTEQFFSDLNNKIVNYIFEANNVYMVFKATFEGIYLEFQTIEFFYEFDSCIETLRKLVNRLSHYICDCSHCENYIFIYNDYIENHFTFQQKFVNFVRWNYLQ